MNEPRDGIEAADLLLQHDDIHNAMADAASQIAHEHKRLGHALTRDDVNTLAMGYIQRAWDAPGRGGEQPLRESLDDPWVAGLRGAMFEVLIEYLDAIAGEQT